jgi:hypothetical protein
MFEITSEAIMRSTESYGILRGAIPSYRNTAKMVTAAGVFTSYRYRSTVFRRPVDRVHEDHVSEPFFARRAGLLVAENAFSHVTHLPRKMIGGSNLKMAEGIALISRHERRRAAVPCKGMHFSG